ncbi:Structural maintenance of chromosomes protein 3 [Elasticomyces elasticus]|nr:Structural maintenance of chromosomes protein 3 [Elasticomyces elasticus]
MSELQKIEQRRMQLENGYGPLREELWRRESDLNSRKDELERKHRQRDNVEDMLRSLGEQMAEYQKELGSGFKKALSNEVERQLGGLEAKLPDLRKEFAGVEGAPARSQACAKLLDTIQTKLNENETGIEETQQHLQNAETSRTAKANTIEDLARAIRNHQKDVSTQVRDLGVLPEAAFSPAYANLASNVATARLHKVQDALKKYGHVNKKAFEQFAQFERQRETLESKREELGTSDGSIRELIDHLDRKKDEAICSYL